MPTTPTPASQPLLRPRCCRVAGGLTYWTYLTPDEVLRGHHAHQTLEQVLFAVRGRLEITFESPAGTLLYFTRPDERLYLSGLYWRI